MGRWIVATQKAIPTAAKWDGVCPEKVDGVLTPGDYTDLLRYIQKYRTSDEPFDVVASGATPEDDLAKGMEMITSYENVGVTWWIEDMSPYRYGWDEKNWTDEVINRLRNRIRKGPQK